MSYKTPEQTARDVWVTREQSGLRTQTGFRQHHMTLIYYSKEDEDNDGDNGNEDTKDDDIPLPSGDSGTKLSRPLLDSFFLIL